MYQKMLDELKKKFEHIIERLSEDIATVRTGRSSSSLVDNISVTYYGSTMPLKQMAQVTTPDPSSIVIQPWDKGALNDIELAIRNSDLGLSPTNDGSFIRISLPPLTEERRNELIRNVSKKGEEGRIALRNIRGEVWDQIKKMEKKSEITQDDRYKAEEELNKIIDEYNRKIEAMIESKEKELKTI
ncbi:MAG: Ribosome-recycling factor [candidate division WS2 bacterium ADurb.Bin280]|uniref:Ribosome-recycling factor n=1 Tax=candidate division WS2 bacterium ADurb.Bin280 TaxID=1852829 RepID=A0A1V5SEU1_9BACT|nr:MAG: Ribosome-recycling factor [candidate division WS2 bacterium ADurb.Bin280]